jgi:hypothetical protein
LRQQLLRDLDCSYAQEALLQTVALHLQMLAAAEEENES